MVILTMLLLLGLPFLMSQSLSLSGSVSYRRAGTVDLHLDSLHDLGADLTTRSGYSTTAPTPSNPISTIAASRLLEDLRRDRDVEKWVQNLDVSGTAFAATLQPERVEHLIREELYGSVGVPIGLQTEALNLQQPDPSQLHVTGSLKISDHSGRIDVNDLDARGWHALLAAVRGYVQASGGSNDFLLLDWDDNEVTDSEDLVRQQGNGALNDNDGGNGLGNIDNDDDNDFGELAEALADLRFSLPGDRITHLEQLLLADPGHNKDLVEPDWDTIYNTTPVTGDWSTVTASYGFRAPLSRSELQLLAPLLRSESTGQGRSGLADLATVIARPVDPRPNFHAAAILDHEVDDLVARGSVVAFQAPLPAEVAPATFAIGSTKRAGTREAEKQWLSWRTGDFLFSRATPHPASHLNTSQQVEHWRDLLLGAAGGIEIPSPVNINAAAPEVIAAIAGSTPVAYPGSSDELLPRLPRFTDLTYPADLTDQAEAAAADPRFDIDATEIHYVWEGLWDRRSTFGWPANPAWQNFYPLFAFFDPRVTGHMRPPLSLRNHGLYQITATSESAPTQAPQGPQQRPGLARSRSRLLQVLPQEHDLQAEWNSQAEWHHLLATGQGSNLASGPRPLNRAHDRHPLRGDSGGNEYVHLRSLPSPTHGQSLEQYAKSNSDRVFGRIFTTATNRNPSGNFFKIASPGSSNSTDPVTSTNSYWSSFTSSQAHVSDDGVTVAATGLAYGVQVQGDTALPVINTVSGIAEIDGFHLDLFFKPVAGSEWSSGVWRIFDTGGTSTEINHLRLDYDATGPGYFVLHIATPAVKSHNVTLLAPRDDHSNATLEVDESCLGDTDQSLFDRRLLAPEVPVRGRTIRHVYRFDKTRMTDDVWHRLQVVIAHPKPGGIAIIVDGLIGRDLSHIAGVAVRDGDQATLPSLILDQDLPQGPDFLPVRNGDELFVDEIACRLSAVTMDYLDSGSISPGEMLFPSSGSVLINNEHIAYSALQSDGDRLLLLDCQRSVRTNTNQSLDDPSAYETRGWPLLEAHFDGDLALPSGVRLPLQHPNERILDGSAVLRYELANGDPDKNYTLWAAVRDADTDGASAVKKINDSTTRIRLGGGANRHHLHELALGPLAEPRFVFVRFHLQASGRDESRYAYGRLESTGSNSFELQDINWFWDDPSTPGNERQDIFGDLILADFDEEIVWTTEDFNMQIIGVELQDSPADGSLDVKDPQAWRQGRFDPGSWLFAEHSLFQVADEKGRIEWISYDTTLAFEHRDRAGNYWPEYAADGSTTGGEDTQRRQLLIDFNGFGYDKSAPLQRQALLQRRSRGRGRTLFVPIYEHLVPDSSKRVPAAAFAHNGRFPVGSQVLPVQCLDSSDPPQHQPNPEIPSYRLRSGDLLTLLSPTQREHAVVRYVATDGYPRGGLTFAPGDSAAWDSPNYLFSLDQAPDKNLDLRGGGQGATLLVGHCYDGVDLSGEGPMRQHVHCMPSAHGSDAVAMLRFGGSSASPPHLMIDAPAVYKQPFRTVGARAAPGALHATDASALSFIKMQGGSIEKDLTELPDNVISAIEVYGISLEDLPQLRSHDVASLGMIRLGDEAFVYRHDSTTQSLFLIGEGLFGSNSENPKTAHQTVWELLDGSRTLRRGVPVLHLPVGPITQLRDGLPATSTLNTPIPITMYLPNTLPKWKPTPFQLVVSQDGKEMEVVKFREYLQASYTDPATSTVVYPAIADFYSATWMRGLYNSLPQAFPAGSLVIGYFPRYAPYYRQGLLRSGQEDAATSAALRSRIYNWLSLPLRLRRMWPAQIGQTEALIINVQDNRGFDGLTLQARAIADSWDWASRVEKELTGIGGRFTAGTNLYDEHTTLASANMFHGCDGVEVKCYWVYADGAEAYASEAIANLSERANRQLPGITSARLNVRAEAGYLDSSKTRPTPAGELQNENVSGDASRQAP